MGLKGLLAHSSRAGKGERDSLLIQTLSEALRLTPESLVQTPYGWVARITGKGQKVAEVAISSSFASKLLAFAYNKGIKRQERLFPVSSTRVWQIVDRVPD
jgi:hypothetical protein